MKTNKQTKNPAPPKKKQIVLEKQYYLCCIADIWCPLCPGSKGAEVDLALQPSSSDELSEFILWVPTVLNSAGLEILITVRCGSFTESEV